MIENNWLAANSSAPPSVSCTMCIQMPDRPLPVRLRSRATPLIPPKLGCGVTRSALFVQPMPCALCGLLAG